MYRYNCGTSWVDHFDDSAPLVNDSLCLYMRHTMMMFIIHSADPKWSLYSPSTLFKIKLNIAYLCHCRVDHWWLQCCWDYVAGFLNIWSNYEHFEGLWTVRVDHKLKDSKTNPVSSYPPIWWWKGDRLSSFDAWNSPNKSNKTTTIPTTELDT